jgi:hypothetical protein
MMKELISEFCLCVSESERCTTQGKIVANRTLVGVI